MPFAKDLSVKSMRLNELVRMSPVVMRRAQIMGLNRLATEALCIARNFSPASWRGKRKLM